MHPAWYNPLINYLLYVQIYAYSFLLFRRCPTTYLMHRPSKRASRSERALNWQQCALKRALLSARSITCARGRFSVCSHASSDASRRGLRSLSFRLRALQRPCILRHVNTALNCRPRYLSSTNRTRKMKSLWCRHLTLGELQVRS